MNLLTLILLTIGLSMDAFAVAICKGLAMEKITLKKAFIVGIWFGGFQALMPMIGYILGVQFEKLINAIAPWIAFVLLAIIGINMIREALSKKCDSKESTNTLGIKEMFVMAVATSIDALAVGVTFALVPVGLSNDISVGINTMIACGIIGIITLLLSMIGVKVGNIFGTKYKSKAEFAGGIILILLGIKILLENFNIFSFM